MNARTNRTLSIGLAVGLLLFVLILSFAGSGGAPSWGLPSVVDYTDSGRRAVFTMLDNLGFRVESWQSPPSSLPRGSATLIMPEAPRALFGEESDGNEVRSPLAKESGRPSRLDSHLPINYQRFIAEGGVLFASAEEETFNFLIEDLELTELEGLELEAVAPGDRRLTELAGSEPLDVEWERRFLLEPDMPVEVWASRGIDSPHVVSLEVGRGELVLFSDQSVLSNHTMRDGDEGYLLIRALVDFDRSGLVLFDEYALGRWSPQSKTALAFSGSFLQVSIQWLALLLIFVWRLCWVGRFPRDPEPLELLSPVSRVRSQAHLVERARRYDLLGRWLVDGVLAKVMKSWRHKPASDKDAQANFEALAKRAEIDASRWRARLFETEVRSPRQLKALNNSLIEFERDAMRSHHGQAGRGKMKQGS